MSSAGYGFMPQTRRIGILTAGTDCTAGTIVGPSLSSGWVLSPEPPRLDFHRSDTSDIGILHSEFALGVNHQCAYHPFMRPLWALVIYIVAVFIGGALLAPWLYWLAQDYTQSFPKLAQIPFHRFVDRSFLILALAGLWPLFRALGATSLRETGLVPPYGQSKKLFGGFLLGFISLAAVAGVVLFAGGRTPTEGVSVGKILETVLHAAGTAAVVATLEEILFRGGVFGGLRRVFYWPLALGLSSLIYALVHFLHRAELTGTVFWFSGLELLPRLLSGFVDFQALIPGFFSLTLVGVLLGLAYQRTGNLYFSIGLHAGWIFWLKIFGTFTADVPKAAAWFWGTGKMIDGWLAFIVLALTLVVFDRLPVLNKRPAFTISS
jgi:membrane protease YdiL (CAAX protease family)